MQFNPPDGYRNTTSFPTKPSSETAFRDSMQDLLDQIRDFLNGADPFGIYAKKAGDGFSGLVRFDNGLIQIGSNAGQAIQINFDGKLAKGTAGAFGTLFDIWTSENSAASLGTSGYQKLASGLVVQWGNVTQASGTSVAFPITFPNSIYQVLAIIDEGSTLTASNVFGLNNSNFSILHGGGATAKIIRFIAVGR